MYWFIKCHLYSEINFFREKFLNLYEVEFHIFTQENLIEHCKRVVEKCGEKYARGRMEEDILPDENALRFEKDEQYLAIRDKT